MIHTLTLNPAIDRTYLVGGLNEHGVSRAAGVLDSASGKGVNVLRVASTLGASARATVVAGGPLGAYFEALCDPDWSIEVIPIEQNTRLNVTLLVENPHVTLKVNEKGPELTEREVAAVLARLDHLLRPGDWLAICGSTPSGVDERVYLWIRQLVESRGALLALDVPNLTLEQLLEIRPNLFKPNAAEFAQITGQRDATLGELVRSVDRLADGSQIDYVIVTLGDLGAVASTGGENLYLPISDPAGTQPVGAGDALLAGFLTGLSRGDRWQDAFALGVGASYVLATAGPTGSLAVDRVVDVAASLRTALVVPDDELEGAPLPL